MKRMKNRIEQIQCFAAHEAEATPFENVASFLLASVAKPLDYADPPQRTIKLAEHPLYVP